MFFRNLLMYRLVPDFRFDAEALQAAMAEKPARPCASQDLSTYGFVAPFGKGEQAPLLHASQGFYLLAARLEERILPGSVVRDAVKDKVDVIEAEQLRKVYKKERDQIKDEILLDYLPRAFTRRKQTFAAIDAQAGLIFVDASSPRAAEDLLSTLRECLGSLPVRPLNVKVSPTATFTQWMKDQAASNGLHLLDRATLADTHEGGGKIAATRQDLGSDEIRGHLNAGKLVTTLSLAWDDKLSFLIDEKLIIRQLHFEDLLHDQAELDRGDDALGQLDASFVLMMLTFREFVPALIEALGGEEVPQEI
ncbi:recombination-associated protein RdgC [Pseudomonas sp. B392_1p]|uniref:recombination-associated protein RdgC n=1 Tax=Pseudomonas sp. B392_1p TaxID=3457507 RepID=UPI003FD1D79D